MKLFTFLKKLFKMNPTPRYLINFTYTVPSGWFGSPEEVLKTMLYYAIKDSKIESYEIKESRLEKKVLSEDVYVFAVKTISKISKPEFKAYMEGGITRIEKINVP